MKRIAFVVATLCFAGALLADTPTVNKEDGKLKMADKSTDLSGFYRCVGREEGGGRYAGMVTISKENGIYGVSWMVGKSSFYGIGIRTDDTLSVGWATVVNDKLVRGVNVYKISGKRLTGRWAILPGSGLVNSETLEMVAELPNEEGDDK